MPDIVLNGATYPDVPGVTLPLSGGGTFTFHDCSGTTATAADVYMGKAITLPDGSTANGSYLWDCRGNKWEYVSMPYDESPIALKDTDFATWTPATTATTIVASANVATFSADLTTYEYLLRWRFDFKAAYQTGATLQKMPYRQVIEIWQGVMKRPNSITNINADNFNANACVTQLTVPLCVYYGNTTGTLTYGFTGSYGIYCAAVAATFSSSTSNTPTVTIKSPSVSARCSTTYMATARAAELDQDNSKFKRQCLLYRMNLYENTLHQMYEYVCDLYRNTILPTS